MPLPLCAIVILAAVAVLAAGPWAAGATDHVTTDTHGSVDLPGSDTFLTEAGALPNGYIDSSDAGATSIGPESRESVPSMSGSGIGAEYEFVPGRLVVRFKEGVPEANRNAALSSVGSAETEQRLLSGRHVLISVPIGAEDQYAALLSSQPDIEAAEKDALRQANTHTSPSLPNDTSFGSQWHLQAIQVEQAWDLSTGAGATVAVLDTGVAYTNLYSTITGELLFAQAPDLAGASFVAPYDAISNDLIPEDDNGHGTHVTGTIAQRTNNSMGVAGIAHNSAIMPVKVCGVWWCPASAVANGITWAVDNGADVISMSLGGLFVSQVERDAVAYAESKDVVVVAAAGNGGLDMVGDAYISYPGALATVISVGAVRFDKTRSSYSNYGTAEGGSSHLHLVGPGGDTSVDQNGDTHPDGVLQNTYLNACTLEPTDFTVHTYCFLQGTSMATPHVAGVAGLLRSEYPSMTASQVRNVLRCSSLDLGASGYDSEFGAGLVQAFEALNDADNNGVPDCLDPAPTPTASPTATATAAATATASPTATPVRSPGTYDPVPGQVFEVSVDIDITGNPTGAGGFLSSIQGNANVPVGDTHLIDVIVDEVAPSDGMGSFGFNLKYDPNVVKIVSRNFKSYMLPGAYENVPAPIPDQTGNWRIDAGHPFTSVNGEGVLVRIGIECVADGTSVLDLADDTGGDGIPNIYKPLGVPITVLYSTDGSITCTSDADADGIPDGADNCPDWPNADQALPPWSVPAGDSDCDGYAATTLLAAHQASEGLLGTDPADACADTPDLFDERGPDYGEPLSPWPPDTNDDGQTTFGDILALAPHFNKTWPDPDYSARFDFFTDGTVDFGDVLQYVPYFNKDCSDYFAP